MIPHPRIYTEQLTDEDLDAILDAAMRVLDETGLWILSDRACRMLAEAGARVDAEARHVRFGPEMVREHLAMAPQKWTLHARNPEKNVEIGGSSLAVCPGYGSAFVADAKGKRRDATLEDFEKFAFLAGSSPAIDVTGGLLVEPVDVPPDMRPAELTRLLITCSDKPFMGSVAGAQGARDSVEMAKIALGDLADKPSVIGLININSPLRLDGRMADAMMEYVSAGQPIILTPGIMIGITAPVTVVGALVQAFAEIIGCVVLGQVVRPGSPVIIGTGGFAADLRDATSGFGRPEQAVGTLLAAQLARRLKLPYRCSAAVTAARRPDCRSGYERMMTALAAWNAGVHFCLQAAGILDSINMMSFEQFVIDTEIWSYIKRIATPPVVSEETLAVETIASAPGDYLSCEHTLEHFRSELYTPTLIRSESYEAWLSGGGEDVVCRAEGRVEEILAGAGRPEMDEDIRRELDKFVDSRQKAINGTP